jgi:hypothetical protein
MPFRNQSFGCKGSRNLTIWDSRSISDIFRICAMYNKCAKNGCKILRMSREHYVKVAPRVILCNLKSSTKRSFILINNSERLAGQAANRLTDDRSLSGIALNNILKPPFAIPNFSCLYPQVGIPSTDTDPILLDFCHFLKA